MTDTVFVALVIELVTVMIAAVWAVSKIKTTTEVLSETMKHLRSSIEKLDLLVERIDEKVDAHGERIAALESSTQTERL